MRARSGGVHHIPLGEFLNKENRGPTVEARPTQFHVDSKSQTVLQTVLAGDKKFQAKEAA